MSTCFVFPWVLCFFYKRPKKAEWQLQFAVFTDLSGVSKSLVECDKGGGCASSTSIGRWSPSRCSCCRSRPGSCRCPLTVASCSTHWKQTTPTTHAQTERNLILPPHTVKQPSAVVAWKTGKPSDDSLSKRRSLLVHFEFTSESLLLLASAFSLSATYQLQNFRTQ